MTSSSQQVLSSSRNDTSLKSFNQVFSTISTKLLPIGVEPSHNLISSLKPLISFLLFSFMYMLPFWKYYPIEHNCFSLLCFVIFVWVTDAIPSYIVPFIIVIIFVWLRIGYDDVTGERMTASEISNIAFNSFFDEVIVINIGIMSIWKALDKLQITDRFSRYAFYHMPKDPKFMLFFVMIINYLLTIYLSNIYPSIIVLDIAMPVIRSLDPDEPFIKAILLGIAWSSNAGSMCSLVSSSHNLIAKKFIMNTNSNVSFFNWMLVGIILSFILLIFEFIYLILLMKTQRNRIVVHFNEAEISHWNIKHTATIIIIFITMILWTFDSFIEEYIGGLGVISCISIFAFFGSNLLDVNDLHRLKWSNILLLASSNILYSTLKKGRLIDFLTESNYKKLKEFPFVLLTLTIIVFFGSFINNIQAASIVFPLILSFTNGYENQGLYIWLSSYGISAAQLFRSSSFSNHLTSDIKKHVNGQPNVITNENFLSSYDFLKYGWPFSIFNVLLISTVGYFIARTRL